MEKIRLNADNGQVLVVGDWYVEVQYAVLATFPDFYLSFMLLLASLFRSLFQISCPQKVGVYGISKCKCAQQPTFPPGRASFRLLVPWFPAAFFPTAGSLPGAPF